MHYMVVLYAPAHGGTSNSQPIWRGLERSPRGKIRWRSAISCIDCPSVLTYRYMDRENVMIHFRLDPRSGVPPYRQLVDQVRQMVSLGLLRAGDQLPRFVSL